MLEYGTITIVIIEKIMRIRSKVDWKVRSVSSQQQQQQQKRGKPPKEETSLRIENQIGVIGINRTRVIKPSEKRFVSGSN